MKCLKCGGKVDHIRTRWGPRKLGKEKEEREIYRCFSKKYCAKNPYFYLSDQDTPPWGIKHECDRWGGWGPDCEAMLEGVQLQNKKEYWNDFIYN